MIIKIDTNSILSLTLLVQLARWANAAQGNALPEPECLNVATNFPANGDPKIADRIAFSETLEAEENDLLQNSTTEAQNGTLGRISISKCGQTILEVKGDNLLHINHLKFMDENGYLLHKGYVTINFLPIKLRNCLSVISVKRRHGDLEIYVIISTVDSHAVSFSILTLASIVRALQLSLRLSDTLEFFSNIPSILTLTTNEQYVFTEEVRKTTAKFIQNNKHSSLLQCPKPEVSTPLNNNIITIAQSLSPTISNVSPTPATKSTSGKYDLIYLVISVVVVLLILFSICMWCLFRRRKSDSIKLTKKDIEMEEREPFRANEKPEADPIESHSVFGDSGIETPGSQLNRSLATSRATLPEVVEV